MDRGAWRAPVGSQELVATEELNTHTQSQGGLFSLTSAGSVCPLQEMLPRGSGLEEQPQFSGKVRQHLEGRIIRGSTLIETAHPGQAP